MIRAFVPVMKAKDYGCVVNVSSIGGSLSLMSTHRGKMGGFVIVGCLVVGGTLQTRRRVMLTVWAIEVNPYGGRAFAQSGSFIRGGKALRYKPSLSVERETVSPPAAVPDDKPSLAIPPDVPTWSPFAKTNSLVVAASVTS